jgi:2-oxo-4-hydroxy-4-carboxy-5-ureidoimidazoline decarboxylase
VGGVAAFNSLPEETATEHLTTCLHAPRWAAAVLAGRPYPDRESLLATAYRFGAVLDDDELESALSRHPRIGERLTDHDPAAGRLSRTEQRGVDAEDAWLASRLQAANVAYEEKFGRVFLIRAAGRTGPQILQALTERLANDPQTEVRVVRDQLAQIAQLRLGVVLNELPSAASPKSSANSEDG